MTLDGFICDGCGESNELCTCHAEREPEEFKGPWSIAVFLIDRAYGGPEEGGWYYGTGEPQIHSGMPLPQFFNSREEASKALTGMRAEIERLELNKGRRDINSVLSEGRYDARVCEGLPTHFPKERPYYE